MTDFHVFVILTTLLIVWWARRGTREPEDDWDVYIERGEIPKKIEENKAKKAKEKRIQREIADLKKRGYSDDVIAIILPTIMNDK